MHATQNAGTNDTLTLSLVQVVNVQPPSLACDMQQSLVFIVHLVHDQNLKQNSRTYDFVEIFGHNFF
jgi:hypothetical protein